jgi:hypothetical protein
MKNNRFCIRLIGLFLGVLTAVNAMAAQVDVTVARSRATQFLASRHAGRLMSQAPLMQLAHMERSTALVAACDYYVFNASDGSAFVIVSGDDRAVEVLGYGDGALDMNRIPCNMQWWLDQYKEQMEYLYAHPGLQVESAPEIQADDENTVMPMLSCNWSQSEPYYNYCPVVNGEHCVTGCVATAMAQVMYYWRFPASCSSLAGYTSRGSTSAPKVDVDPLPGTDFAWDNMLDSYLGNYSAEQADAVATLMRYCGQSVSMSYGVNGSGAYVNSQLNGMRFMGYSSGMSHVYRRSYSRSNWISTISNEMKAGRPILYSGDDPSGGHAFVLDGMRDGLFHINWGWAGTGNGFFAVDAFNVRGYEFNNSQEMIIRITPSIVDNVRTEYDFEKDGIYYRIEGDEAVVTYCDTRYNSYSGNVTVPSQVVEGGKLFRVTSIGPRAFRNCLHLTYVTLPDEIESIGDQAFANCLNMERIDLPRNLKTIGEYAFEECAALQVVSVSGALQRVESKAFHQCNALREVLIDDLEPWYGIYFVDVTSNPLYFAHRLIVDGTRVEHLVVPGTVSEIGRCVFAGFSELKSVEFLDGVKTVGYGAFSYCDGLQTVIMSGSTEQVNRMGFYGCTSLERLQLSESLTTIGDMAFDGCSSLTSLVMPASLTDIGENAFHNCAALSSVVVNRGLRSVGTDAFLGCTEMVQVVTEDLESWCRISFDNDYSNPLRLSRHLYINDEELTEIHIPASVTRVGNHTFAGASQVTSVTLGSHVTAIGSNAFGSCKNLTQVTMDKRLKSIGSRAFNYCTSLERIVVGDGVKHIADSAFFFCSGLKHVTLGTGLRSIGKKVFFMCDAIDTLACRAMTPPVVDGTTAFFTYKSLLMVPEGSETDYQKADVWKKFTNIVGVDFGIVITGDVNGDREVNIADVNGMIDVILFGLDAGEEADVNGDGEINIADINALIDIILGND